jgi:HlyD family secretion protein
VIASAGGYALIRRSTGTSGAPIALDRYVAIKPQQMDITVAIRGELQAVENIELVSRVEGRATITDIVKEGAFVKKDDVLVQLDSSSIRQQIDDLALQLQSAEAAVANAEEMLAIQESNNAAETEGAIVTLQLAELDFKKYIEGTFPQSLSTANTTLAMAKIDLQNKQEDLAQTKGLFTRGFVTAADVKKAELAVTQASNSVEEAETGLRVLNEFSHRADLAAKQNAVAQAKSRLERVRRQNNSMLNQKRVDLSSAQQQLQVRQRRMDYLNQQLAACTIRAPADGMVVYSNNPDNQSMIAEGSEVRERQPIIRLPDTSAMKAMLKLNEAQANRVQPGMRASIAISGIPQPLAGTVSKVSIVPVSGNRWVNPDSKEYPAEVTLDETPPNLKPSTSAEATIMVRSIDNALTVPLESLYSSGSRTFVFTSVAEDQPIVPRPVKVGDASLTRAQIVSGIDSGDRVLILEAGEGKTLLEKAGIKIEPTSQPASNRGGERRNRNTAASQPTASAK